MFRAGMLRQGFALFPATEKVNSSSDGCSCANLEGTAHGSEWCQMSIALLHFHLHTYRRTCILCISTVAFLLLVATTTTRSFLVGVMVVTPRSTLIAIKIHWIWFLISRGIIQTDKQFIG